MLNVQLIFMNIIANDSRFPLFTDCALLVQL